MKPATSRAERKESMTYGKKYPGSGTVVYKRKAKRVVHPNSLLVRMKRCAICGEELGNETAEVVGDGELVIVHVGCMKDEKGRRA